MGNHISSSSYSGRTRNLVLVGTGIAVTAVAWKCGFFQRSKKSKALRKESNNTPQETRMKFADLCALVVVIGTSRLSGVYDLNKISKEGTDHQQSIDRQFVPDQSTSTLIDSNSTNCASQLQEASLDSSRLLHATPPDLNHPPLHTIQLDRPSDKVGDSTSSVCKEIKIMTYNLCHPQKESLHARMLAVTHLVQRHVPDVVLFQEATPEMQKIFRSSRIWDSYESVAGKYNCVVFSKVPMNSLDSVIFSKGGELLLTKIEFKNKNDLFIATSHLNRSIEKRMPQAKQAIKRLHSYRNIIFGGDMNWRNGTDLIPLKPGWIDAWEHIRPQEQGYTFDTVNNPSIKGRKMLRERLDRFLCKLNDYELLDIEIVGKEKIPVFVPCESAGEFEKQSVIVSDHYGLILTVRVI